MQDEGLLSSCFRTSVIVELLWEITSKSWPNGVPALHHPALGPSEHWALGA